MDRPAAHPRTVSWQGASALAMGGSNQSLFLIGALVASQGTGAVPLLVVGIVLSWAALPGWIELTLMWPDRVGGIAATCAEAFRPYSPVLANLTGVAYWWGWVPTCGLTALLSASALHHWYLPGTDVKFLATGIVVIFVAVNLVGVRWVTRLAVPLACASASLAFLSATIPVFAGSVDWARASTFSLEQPFGGVLGTVTSAMAGLYLIGFAAPAFEAAACHVGEMRDPARSLPRAMFASAGMASVFFLVLPVIWLGVLGPSGLEGELMRTLGPTFAPLVGGAAKAFAIWFMVLNMFHGTLQPLAGASRTMSQLSEDGLVPRTLGRRNRNDVPWVATVLTAAMSILFLLSGVPTWIIAAANFCYLIAIGLPSVAVWLLRRDAPEHPRPYVAPRGWVVAGVVAAGIWGLSTILGFQQFGLPTVIAGLVMAYTGSLLYVWRTSADRRARGERMWQRSLHVKLTGAMILVLVLDGAGYLLAVSHVEAGQEELLVILSDIFVVVAMLTVSVGLVLPGMIAHAAGEVATAADRLARGTLSDLTRAMQALGAARLDDAHARVEDTRVDIRSKDEIGAMAGSFNRMQDEAHRAAQALDVAREGLRTTEDRLQRTIEQQAAIAHLGQIALESGDVDDVLDQLVHDAARLVRVDLAILVETTNGAAWVRSAAGPRSGQIQRLAHVPGPLSAQEVIREDRFDEVDPLRAAWGRAGVSLPVPGGDGVAMSLCCVRATSGGFDEEELDYLRAAVNILAEARSRRRSEQELLYQALHDPLTGLPNRALFLDRLRYSLASSSRRGTTTGVMFLDLDQFKLVNDSLGHAAGDDLLRQVARRLADCVRPWDTVARFGGDEFLVIADSLEDVTHAKEIAGRLVHAMLAPFRLSDGQDLVVRSSIGIGASVGAATLAEDLIREADAAMYRAKERGRDRVEVYDEVMRSRATSRLTLGNSLSHAVERDELVLHYQPIVDLRDGRITGFETLLRWMHPERGLVPPSEFIPLAEATGLIVEMGAWVLHEACRQAAAWRHLAPSGRAPSIAVNLSLRQVTEPGVVGIVAHALAASGLPPEALHLEITESVLMEEGDATIATLDALKALGVVLVLDDFGTGYSSLAYVRRFPIDVLKVDRSFIADLDTGGADAFTIVNAIVRMADGLRVAVIAEGIERPEQIEVLRDVGCHIGQGYYFATPQVESEVLWLLEADSALPHVVA